jgi:hypothetical protein
MGKVKPIVPLVVELEQKLRYVIAALDQGHSLLRLMVARELLDAQDVKVLGDDRLRVQRVPVHKEIALEQLRRTPVLDSLHDN